MHWICALSSNALLPHTRTRARAIVFSSNYLLLVYSFPLYLSVRHGQHRAYAATWKINKCNGATAVRRYRRNYRFAFVVFSLLSHKYFLVTFLFSPVCSLQKYDAHNTLHQQHTAIAHMPMSRRTYAPYKVYVLTIIVLYYCRAAAATKTLRSHF